MQPTQTTDLDRKLRVLMNEGLTITPELLQQVMPLTTGGGNPAPSQTALPHSEQDPSLSTVLSTIVQQQLAQQNVLGQIQQQLLVDRQQASSTALTMFAPTQTGTQGSQRLRSPQFFKIFPQAPAPNSQFFFDT